MTNFSMSALPWRDFRFVERLGIQRNIPTDRYSFEKQETDLRAGEELCAKRRKDRRSRCDRSCFAVGGHKEDEENGGSPPLRRVRQRT